MSTGLIERIISKTGFWKPEAQPDRRRAKRYRMDLPVQFRVRVASDSDRFSPLLSGKMCDLSELGMGLLTDQIESDGLHMVDPDSHSSEQSFLEIHIPQGREPLTVKGRAIWYVRHPEGQSFSFRLGVQFINVTPDFRKTIRDFIDLYLCANDIPSPGFE